MLFSTQKYKDCSVQTYNFPVLFYECETWYFTLREEHRLRVFDNRVLRKIFGSEGRGKKGVEAITYRGAL
jgi:hypothetical protein